MTAPTVAVTVSLSAMGGPAIAGVVITATMDVNEVYQGFVVAQQVTATTDDTGTAVLHLFPNAPSPSGLGTQGSTYRVRATVPGGRPLDVQARVPNSACNLDEVLAADESTALTPAQTAVSQAQAAASQADAAAAAVAYLYPNTYATDPATRPDGSAVQAGDRYKNSTDSYEYQYVGGAWDSDAKKAANSAADAATSADSAGGSAAGAAGSRSAIDNRLYPNTYATAPTTRPDGSAIQDGDRYINSTDSYEYIRVGGAWRSDVDSAQAAEVARYAAEAARDAAAVTGKIYADTATGLANTSGTGATNRYFSVPSGVTGEFLILYLNNAGAAQEVKRYLSSEFFTNGSPVGYSWALVGSNGFAAFGVREDGTVDIAAADILEADVDNLTAGDASVTGDASVGGDLSVADGNIQVQEVFGYAYTVTDADGRAAVGVKDDGTWAAKKIEADNIDVTTINGQIPGSGLIERLGGMYSHQINFINNTGQSLGEGSSDNLAITTTQEYDNIGFPRAASSPTAFVTLTTDNTGAAGRGECPMYGTLGFAKKLIAKENGISYTYNDYQLAACNNAFSGSSITVLNKGTSHYATVLTQVQAAFNIAQAAGKSMSYQAFTWTQGESDSGAMTKDQYKALLIQLAKDYNNDGKAITGQFNDVRCITYQCANTVNQTIGLAQLEASNECPLITMACPMYQFTYGNTLHIDSTSEKWLGGYYGLVYKRVIVDGDKNWKPLQPVGHAVLGSSIDLIFNRTGLVFDTTLVAAQVNQGFTVKNGGGVAQTISSVSIVAPNRVRITVSGTPASGWSVQYGVNAAIGRSDAFVGGCGNLRDSQGDFLVYDEIGKKMHNWCVIFDYSI